MNGAGTTTRCVTTNVCASELQLIAQKMYKQSTRLYFFFLLGSIDGDADLHRVLPRTVTCLSDILPHRAGCCLMSVTPLVDSLSYLTVSVALRLGALAQVIENVPRWGSGTVFDPFAGTTTKVAPTLMR